MKSTIISLFCITTAFASAAEERFRARMAQSQKQAQAEAEMITNKRLAREKMVTDESVARQNVHQNEATERQGLWEAAKQSVQDDRGEAAIENKFDTLDEEELWRHNLGKQLQRETDEWRSLNDDLRRKYIVDANFVNTDPKFIILTTGEGKYTKRVRVRRDLCTKYFSLIRDMIDDQNDDETNIIIPIHGDPIKKTVTGEMTNPGGQTPAPLIHLMEWLEKFDTAAPALTDSDTDGDDDGDASAHTSVSKPPMLRMTPNLIFLAKYLGFICDTCKEPASQMFVANMTNYLLDPYNVALVEDMPLYAYQLAIKQDPGRAFFLDNLIKTRSIQLVNNNLAKVINPDYAIRNEELRDAWVIQNKILVVIPHFNSRYNHIYRFDSNFRTSHVKTIVIHTLEELRVENLPLNSNLVSIVLPDKMIRNFRYHDDLLINLEKYQKLQEIWVKRGSITEQNLENQPNYRSLQPLIRYLGEDESKVHNFLHDFYSKPRTETAVADASSGASVREGEGGGASSGAAAAVAYQ